MRSELKAKFTMRLLCAAVVTALICPAVVMAITPDPREGIPAPPGTDVVFFYYKSISGNQHYTDGNKDSKNYNIKADLGIARYMHYGRLMDTSMTWAFNVIQPFGSKTLEVTPISQSSNGLADTTAQAILWYPVVNQEGAKIWALTSFYVSAPTGEYANDRLVNLGANRWSFKPEAAVITRLKRLAIEVGGSIEYYTDNNDYTVAGLKQVTDPLYTTGIAISYDITKSFWLGISGFWSKGAENTNNGIKDIHSEVDTKLGKITGGFTISNQCRLNLQYEKDLSVENGIATNTISVRFTYNW